MAAFNTFAVLKPEFRETYAPKKLRQPKLAKPTNINIGKKPKVIMPGGPGSSGIY